MTEPSDRLGELWDRLKERAVTRSQIRPGVGAWTAVLGSLAAAWAITYWAGGTTTAWPHVFYVPVVVAGLRFGLRSTLVVSVVAGVLAGPLMPLDVAAGTSQSASNWLIRLGAFVVIGQLTAYLSRYSMPSVGDELMARRYRRRFIAAIEDGEVFLEYQPIVDLADGTLYGVEALARWAHPTLGLIEPAVFVSHAERLGYTGVLTDFVIRRACADVAGWHRSGLMGKDSFDLTVNVSVRDLSDPGLPELVEEVLAETQLPNHWLYLEVTETALVGDEVATVVDRLMDLRMLGIRLAIDDFGTGESSLGQLQRYPVDTLKIDGMFVRQLDQPDSNGPIVAAIVAMGRALGHSIIAEGIETPRQARIVQALGCERGQGFLFSFPMPADDLLRLLGRRQAFAADNAAHLRAPQPGPVQVVDHPLPIHDEPDS